MYLDDQHIKQILIENDEQFKTLNREHQHFDLRLQELEQQQVKTETQLIEEKNLKKQKLKIKDSMQRYISEYRKGSNS